MELVQLNLLLHLQVYRVHVDPILLLLDIDKIKQQKIYIMDLMRLQIGIIMELV